MTIKANYVIVPLNGTIEFSSDKGITHFSYPIFFERKF